MGLLGLDALQWFVVLDLFVLMASTTIAAALFVRIRAREKLLRGVRRAEPLPVTEESAR